MPTMPPISRSRSAPLMCTTSPAASISASQARRSCFGVLEARLAARGSTLVFMALLQNLAAISPLGVDNSLQPLRRHRQHGDGAGNADGVVDRGGNGGADCVHAALARALDAERIERSRIVLGQDDLDVRRLSHGGHEIIGESDRERIAALV